MVRGTTMYLACGVGLQIIDVSEPAAPRLLGFCEIVGANDIALSGDLACITSTRLGLVTVNVADPAFPVRIGRTMLPGLGNVRGDRRHLRLCRRLHGRPPGCGHISAVVPQRRGSCDTPGTAYSVAVGGGRAYLADANSGLEVFDLSNPAVPTLLGSRSAGMNSLREVIVSGTYAFASDEGAHCVRVLNASNPASIGLLASPATIATPENLTLADGVLLVAEGDLGIEAFDVSNPAAPGLKFAYNTPSRACDTAAAEGFLYIADADTVEVLSFGGPSLMDDAGVCALGDSGWSLAVNGRYAYVGSYSPEISIVDVGDPGAPRLVGRCATYGAVCAVAAAGTYVYAATDAGLQVIDATSPAAPRVVGCHELAGEGLCVTLVGDLAYVGDRTRLPFHLRHFRAQFSVLRGSCQTVDRPQGVTVRGQYAYVALFWSGFAVIDVSDPTSPRQVGSCGTTNYALGVALTATHAFVADGYQSVQVIDISDPLHPAVVGSRSSSGRDKGGGRVRGLPPRDRL